MVKKIIRVYLVKKNFLEENMGNFNTIYLDVWKEIKEKLSYKYDFQETYIEPDYNKYFEMLSKNKIDILVSPVFVTKERMNKCLFTIPLYVVRPTVIFPFLEISNHDFINFVKFYIKIWIRPFILLVTFAFLFSILINQGAIKNMKNIIQSVTFIIGNHGYLNILKKHKDIYLFSFMMMISLFLINFLHAYTTSFGVKFVDSYNSMDISLKDKKIMVGEDSNLNINNILKAGAIPIKISNKQIEKAGGIENYYLKNINKADGCYITYLTKVSQRSLNARRLRMSNYYFSSYFSSFGVNKKQKGIYLEINNILHRMKINGDLQSICVKHDTPDKIIIC